MAGTAGKKARVKIGATSGGAFTVIAGIKSISHSIEGQSVDDSEFGVEWMQFIQGLNGGKISLSGNRRLDDTDGQIALLAYMLAGTKFWVQVLPDNGTTANAGFKQEVICTKFGTDTDVAGGNALSIELQGTGVITLV